MTADVNLELQMRRVVFVLAIVVAWFSLTKGERQKLSKAGREALARGAKHA